MFPSLFAIGALLAVNVAAQTSTSCNPLDTTCPDDPALGTTYFDVFNASTTELQSQLYNVTAGASLVSFGDNGMEMSISSSGQSVTVESAYYIFWGQVEILLKAAKGQGIISTMILISDDLDEHDWEIKGSLTTNVSTNWYGHGNTSQFNSEYFPLSDPTENFHNYTISYQQESSQFILDGHVVRTINYAESGQYPQTPMKVRFGIWSAGDTKYNKPGTVEWAGGPTNWDDGPFTAYVQSIRVTDGHTNTSSYSYGDKTGSYQSIKVATGESSAAKYLDHKTTLKKAENHWNGLSKAAKIGIAAGVVGGFALFSIIFAIFCIKQRKAGRIERIAADKAWEGQQAEMLAYRQQMSKGGFAVSGQPPKGQGRMPYGQRF